MRAGGPALPQQWLGDPDFGARSLPDTAHWESLGLGTRGGAGTLSSVLGAPGPWRAQGLSFLLVRKSSAAGHVPSSPEPGVSGVMGPSTPVPIFPQLCQDRCYQMCVRKEETKIHSQMSVGSMSLTPLGDSQCDVNRFLGKPDKLLYPMFPKVT